MKHFEAARDFLLRQRDVDVEPAADGGDHEEQRIPASVPPEHRELARAFAAVGLANRGRVLDGPDSPEQRARRELAAARAAAELSRRRAHPVEAQGAESHPTAPTTVPPVVPPTPLLEEVDDPAGKDPAPAPAPPRAPTRPRWWPFRRSHHQSTHAGVA